MIRQSRRQTGFRKTPTSSADVPGFLDLYHKGFESLQPAHNAINLSGVRQHYANGLAEAVDAAVRENSRPRILITGEADEQLLGLVSGVLRERYGDDRGCTVLVDASGMAVRKIREYAKKTGASVKAYEADARRLPARLRQGDFNLVITDSLLYFFSSGDQRQVLDQWRQALKPGACVYTQLCCHHPPEAVTPEQIIEFNELAKDFKSTAEYDKYTSVLSLLDFKGHCHDFQNLDEIVRLCSENGFSASFMKRDGAYEKLAGAEEKKVWENSFISTLNNRAFIKARLVKEPGKP